MMTSTRTPTSLALSSPTMAASYIFKTPFPNPSSLSYNRTRKSLPPSTSTTTAARRCCQVASVSSSSSQVQDLEEELEATEKVGRRVKVKVPLKVYHVPRVPEVDLTDMEGVIKQYVGLWKGKKISANLPFKVEFHTEVEGRGKVKFSAHLTEDEFEYID